MNISRPQLPRHFILLFGLSFLAAASTWFYVNGVMRPAQIAEERRPRGNLSDLYPRWLGARELLLHGRNPYSTEITAEIQKGYYGRVLDPSLPGDPKDQQAFAYPVYVVFLLAPTIKLPFPWVQAWYGWILAILSVAAVWCWLKVLQWKVALAVGILFAMLLLGSFPEVQAIKLQQLSLLATALLAFGTALLAGGYLFLGGLLLALATIKPQLALPLVLVLLVWAATGFRNRWRFAAGLATMMTVLLVASEVVLPGWFKMFWQALRDYRQYTDNKSVLDQLANWAVGPWGGIGLALAAGLACSVVLWKLRAEPSGSGDFGRGVALVLALTVMIVPKTAPYNQVLLLPAILSLARERSSLLARSKAVRIVYMTGVFALGWAWLASLGLGAVWLFSPVAAMNAREMPLYATFSLPVLVFLLTFVSVRQHAALRAADTTR
jgi:hypothetical protein